MKKVILIVAIYVSLFAETKGNLTASQVSTAQKLIKAYGYKCDSVDFALHSSWSGVISVTCNGKYRYAIEDKGGRWVVTLE